MIPRFFLSSVTLLLKSFDVDCLTSGIYCKNTFHTCSREKFTGWRVNWHSFDSFSYRIIPWEFKHDIQKVFLILMKFSAFIELLSLGALVTINFVQNLLTENIIRSKESYHSSISGFCLSKRGEKLNLRWYYNPCWRGASNHITFKFSWQKSSSFSRNLLVLGSLEVLIARSSGTFYMSV